MPSSPLYDRLVIATEPVSTAAAWRPQLFGDKRPRSIEDPVVEPLWTGPRVLVLVDRGQVTMTDVVGDRIDGHRDLVADLQAAVGSATVILEASLTTEPVQPPAEIARREALPVPTAGALMTQMVIGRRGDRKDRLAARAEEARLRSLEVVEGQLALVAVDLLWLDDESLCEVPLLERKRILESVLPESRLVRVGIHVRPPIDTWLGSWRAFGFRRIAFKAANSRYRPGAANPEWALAEIPAR